MPFNVAFPIVAFNHFRHSPPPPAPKWGHLGAYPTGKAPKWCASLGISTATEDMGHVNLKHLIDFSSSERMKPRAVAVNRTGNTYKNHRNQNLASLVHYRLNQQKCPQRASANTLLQGLQNAHNQETSAVYVRLYPDPTGRTC